MLSSKKLYKYQIIHKATTTIPLPSFNNIVTSKMSRVLTILSIFLLSLPIISTAQVTAYEVLESYNLPVGMLPLVGISTAQPTAYEVLESYNLPVGLLPLGVTGYTLDKQTGRFEVNVPWPCSCGLGNLVPTYLSPFSGVISKNKLTNVKGFSLRMFSLMDVDIVEVSREGDNLSLHLLEDPPFSLEYDVSEFSESPQCG